MSFILHGKRSGFPRRQKTDRERECRRAVQQKIEYSVAKQL
jgi:hypothetical protein